jgi:GDPmannose 4,6-dehydratase
MPKALILGATGQDGSLLARFLVHRGYEVVGTSRDAAQARVTNLQRLGVADRVRMETVTTNDFRSVIQLLMRFQPDEIYHLAGQSSVGMSFQQPVETMESILISTLNMLEAIRLLDRKVRYYNAGSSECFGNTEEAASETTPFRPRSPYAVAKSAAFWQIANYREAYGLYACTGILFNHESPLRPERFVTAKIVAAAKRIRDGSGERLQLGNIDVQRDWGWAAEYIDAMWRMLQQDSPDDYVIATGETHPLRDFVAAAFAACGLEWRDHVDVNAALLRPSEIMVSRSRPEKAQARLGWTANRKLAAVIDGMIREDLAGQSTAVA